MTRTRTGRFGSRYSGRAGTALTALVLDVPGGRLAVWELGDGRGWAACCRPANLGVIVGQRAPFPLHMAVSTFSDMAHWRNVWRGFYAWQRVIYATVFKQVFPSITPYGEVVVWALPAGCILEWR